MRGAIVLLILVGQGQPTRLHYFNSKKSYIYMHIRPKTVLIVGAGPLLVTLSPPLCVYDLTNDREERLAPFDAGWNETCIMDESVRPSMLQKLMNYCTDITWTQIRQEQRYRQWHELYEALLQSRA